MVHFLTRIDAAVVSGVTARVLGGRMAGILERGLLTVDVGGLLAHVRPVAGLGIAARGEVHRLTAVHSGRHIVMRTGLRLGRRILDHGKRPVEHGSLRRITMAFAAEPAVAAGLVVEPAVPPAVLAAVPPAALAVLAAVPPAALAVLAAVPPAALAVLAAVPPAALAALAAVPPAALAALAAVPPAALAVLAAVPPAALAAVAAAVAAVPAGLLAERVRRRRRRSARSGRRSRRPAR